MITCSRCEVSKPETEFSFKNKAKNIRQHYCKECHKAYVQAHYQGNKQKYLDRANQNRDKEKQKTKDLLTSLKCKCEKCGEDHPAVLDFHHIDPTEKEYTISQLQSRKKIIEEAEKCVVLCSNCHRKLHYEEKNS